MHSSLRILHLEDSPNDAELVGRFLKKANMGDQIRVVADKDSFEQALRDFDPDVILSDHTLPQFNSISALKIARSHKAHVPFILITGTVSEEFAVECIRNGADDYILKSNLLRLPNAIRQTLSEKQAVLRLRESEERYRQIVETAQEGICIFNTKLEIEFANRKMCAIFGYTCEDLQWQKFSQVVEPEDRHLVKEAMKEAADKIELRCRTREGGKIWVELTTSPVWDAQKNFTGILAMVSDVTERVVAHDKLVQSEQQIRNFAQHLNQTMEAESARIAREIHDELGQQLASIKMTISSLKRTPESERAEKIESVVKDVDQTIQSMRKIATELRPGILDTLGLIPSIEWLASEFERKTGVKCTQTIRVRESKFPNHISVCFFRVCQESLTNITKHAQADHVSVSVEQTDHQLRLTVSDNGRGIAGEELENPFSMGLLGMRERARVMGADLQITSSPNKGTQVQLTAKLK